MRQDEMLVSTIETDEAPMIEATGVPVIYCDGIGGAEVHGDNVRVTYYELQRIGGEEVRVPVLRMIRPRRSCGPKVERMLAARAPYRGDVRHRGH